MTRLLWTQRQDFGPTARFGHAMVFDMARRQVLLMGGQSSSGAYLADTWTWDGDTWTQVADMGPTPRSNHAMAYDSSRQRVVMFGGSNGDTSFGDTWEWDGEAWTQMSDSGPSARSGTAMTFASADNQVLLVGGASARGDLLGDTWTWDGTRWTQLEDSGLPPRRDHVIADDSVRRRVVVFGGRDVSGSRGDTWEWDGKLWTQEADFGPPACFGASMVFASAHCTLYGGVSGVTTASNPTEVFRTTWDWDGHHWTARQDIGPGPRVAHAMTYDAARHRVVLFGGVTTPWDAAGTVPSARSDTWDCNVGGDEQPGAIPLASVTVSPDTISSATGGFLTVSVKLVAPAPAEGNLVRFSYASDAGTGLLANARFYGGVVVGAGRQDADVGTEILPRSLVPQTLSIEAFSGEVAQTATVTVTP